MLAPRSSSLIGFVLAAVLASTAASAQAKNPYLEPAQRLYLALEFQDALAAIEKGLRWGLNTPEEDVLAGLLEGVITAQLGKRDRAIRAFTRALAMNPKAELPFKVSPKIQKLFDDARAQVAKTAPVAAAPPPPPAVAAPEPAAAPAPAVAEAPAAVVPAPAPVAEPGKPAVVAAPAPEEKKKGLAHGPLLGVAGLVDVVGRSYGLEAFAGYQLAGVQLVLRVRPGPQTGLGLSAGYELTLAERVGISLAARVDLYVPTMVVGLGGVAGARVKIVGPLGVLAAFSVEGFPNSGEQFRPLALVLTAGADVRF